MTRLGRAPGAPPEAAPPARSPVAVPAGAATFLALVAFHPGMSSPWFSMKAAVLLVAGAAGLPLLVRLAAAGDGAARAALAMVAWSGLSAALSGSPLAWSGQFSLGTGALFVACLAGVWAIGRHLDASARRLVVAAVVAGAIVNAAVAVLQGPVNLSRYSVYLRDGRSTGLMGNPVFLGAVCAVALPLLLPRLPRRPVSALAMAALFAAGAQMSGSRVALALLAGSVVAGVLRAGLARTATLAAAVALGVAAGTFLQADRAETSALARFSAEPASGLDGRVENWRGGLEAAREKPLAGHGPGLYAAAAGPHRSLALARRFGPDSLFQDAHNLAVEYAATTGVVGLVLLAAWLALSFLGALAPAEPELLVAAGVAFAFQLLEPQNVAVTPLGFLLLGAAVAAARPFRPSGARWPTGVASAVLATLALVPSAALLAGDSYLRLAVLDFDEDAADRAATWLRPWAAPLSVETRIHLFRNRAERLPGQLVAALASAGRAVDREPDNPRRQVELGGVYARLGRHRAAAAAFARALDSNPWSVLALRGRAGALDVLGRKASAAACRRLALLASDATRSGSGLGRSRSQCSG